jgi:hypothetical protein
LKNKIFQKFSSYELSHIEKFVIPPIIERIKEYLGELEKA